MAAVWGEAEVELHIDGRALPGEVRRATEVAATEGGKEFRKRFRAFMIRSAAEGVRDFARVFNREVVRLFRTTRTFRFLQRSLVTTRRAFNDVSYAVRNTFSLAMDTVRRRVNDTLQPLRDFRFAVGARMTQAFRAFRDNISILRISMDDLRRTFPPVFRAIDNVRDGFVRGRAAVVRFGNRIRQMLPDFTELRESAARVSEQWGRLTNRFRNLTILFRDGRAGLRAYKDTLKEVADTDVEVERRGNAITRMFRRKNNAVERSVSPLRRLLSVWKRFPHGFRQFLFWTTFVIAALGNLSVLSSALSGTLLGLVTILGALGAGAGIAVAGFAGLYAETAKLTDGAKESKRAFSDLGDAFARIRDVIANSMFGNMADSIDRITNNLLPALEDNIAAFAERVGDNLGKIFDALSSDEGIKNFEALLDGFGPILDAMTDAAIAFGDAFADILIVSLPFAQRFAEAIRDIAERFSEWTSSEEGRRRIQKFLETAERIMPLVVDLFVALSNALANLVTPETISGTETFLQALTDFMPILGEIVEIVANLNVFGLLAVALETIGAILEPILPILGEFTALLSEKLIEGMEKLAPKFEELGEALGPILELLGELLIAILPPLIDVIILAIENFAAWIDVVAALVEPLTEDKDAMETFGDTVKDVMTVVLGIFTFTTPIITGLLKSIAALLRGDIPGAFHELEIAASKTFSNLGITVDGFYNNIENLAVSVHNWFTEMTTPIRNWARDVIGFFRDVIGWIKDAVNWFKNLFGAADRASGAVNRAGGGGGRGNLTAASGMLLTGPTRVLAGEAGPEAIVPLRRPLNQVDPAVRWLSAIAQGKAPAMANGGVVGGGRSVTIEPGAVQVIGSVDPRRTALEVVNRLAERIAG